MDRDNVKKAKEAIDLVKVYERAETKLSNVYPNNKEDVHRFFAKKKAILK